MSSSSLPVGDTGEALDTFKVPTTAEPAGAHREAVVLTSPTNPDGVADVVNTAPADDAYGVVARIAGQVETGLTQPTTPADTQPVSGTVGADSVRRPTLTATYTTSTAETAIALTPSAGKKLRISWYSLQAGPDNASTVTAAIRWGAAGDDIHTVDLSRYGQMFAHSFGGADDYIEGAVDQSLYLFTSAAQRTILNLDYKEVAP